MGANECPLQELTGKLPRSFPLETGEKPPLVQRRAGLPPNTKAEVSQHLEYQLCLPSSCSSLCTCGPTSLFVCPWLQDEAAQKKQMKAIFTGALYRHSESDRNVPNSKRTVHRGCHTGISKNHLQTYPLKKKNQNKDSLSLSHFFQTPTK